MGHVIDPVYQEAELDELDAELDEWIDEWLEARREARREAQREAEREAQREAQREAHRKLVARMDAMLVAQAVPATRGSPLVPVARNLLAQKLKQSLHAARDARAKRK